MSYKTINQVLKDWRKHRRLTQWQLADKLGVHQSEITRIEGTANITMKKLEQVAEALDLEITIKIKPL